MNKETVVISPAQVRNKMRHAPVKGAQDFDYARGLTRVEKGIRQQPDLPKRHSRTGKCVRAMLRNALDMSIVSASDRRLGAVDIISMAMTLVVPRMHSLSGISMEKGVLATVVGAAAAPQEAYSSNGRIRAFGVDDADSFNRMNIESFQNDLPGLKNYAGELGKPLYVAYFRGIRIAQSQDYKEVSRTIRAHLPKLKGGERILVKEIPELQVEISTPLTAIDSLY